MIHSPDVRILAVDFQPWAKILADIRMEVFVAEQGVPEALEMDDRDGACRHFLATVGEAFVGTVRLDVAQEGKIGRLAVRREWRQQGIGSQLMMAAQETAKGLGLSRVWCHAQTQALPFYWRLGYQTEGEEFVEAGISHYHLSLQLS